MTQVAAGMGHMLFLVKPDDKVNALPDFEPAVLEEESKTAEAIIDGAADGKGGLYFPPALHSQLQLL